MILIYFKNRYENVNVDVKFKPPWFVELNPLGKVPTIQVKAKIFLIVKLHFFLRIFF